MSADWLQIQLPAAKSADAATTMTHARVFSGKRFAIVANTAWNIANFRLPLARAIMNRGGTVIAVAPPDDHVDEIVSEGIPFVPLLRLGRKSLSPTSDLNLMLELREIYKSQAIDCALQFTIKPVIYGNFASRWTSTLTVSTITGLGYAFIKQGWIRRLALLLYRHSLRNTQLVVFQNTDDMELFLNHRAVDPRKTRLIRGSGVDITEFVPAHRERTNGGTVFVFVGRLLRDKGVCEYLEAAKRILANDPRHRFHVIGANDVGNPASLSDQEIAFWKRQDGIVFHGYVKDIRRFLAHCDIVVLPSYREGLPRVIIEAMAMAKPCITTDVPGCRDTIDHGVSGLVVQPKNTRALQEAMEAMTEFSSEKLHCMGNAGRHKVEKMFSTDVVVEQCLHLLAGMLGAARG